MSTNDITGDNIVTGVPSKEYLDNYDKIFKKTNTCGCKERCIKYEVEYNEYLDMSSEQCQQKVEELQKNINKEIKKCKPS